MKVFISWSGEFSKKIAISVKDWLEQCIQSVEAFVSQEDIEKGENWSSRLTNELSNTNYGIICLTSDNILAPWIHFEAGAISKLVDSRVATIATDIPYSDIKGPLSGFQNIKLEKADMFGLLKSINLSMDKCGEKCLNDDKLKNSFDAFWTNFENRIKLLFEEHQKEPTKKASNKIQIQQELIDELLQLTRNQNAILSDPARLLPYGYLEAIFKEIRHENNNEKLFEIVKHHLMRMTRLLVKCNEIDSKYLYQNYIQELDMFMYDISNINKEWRMRIRDIREEFEYIVMRESSKRKMINE